MLGAYATLVALAMLTHKGSIVKTATMLIHDRLLRRCHVGLFWSGYASLPGMATASNDPYRGFRFPAEIIQHAVWLYHCFSLSRDVELILAERAIAVSL